MCFESLGGRGTDHRFQKDTRRLTCEWLRHHYTYRKLITIPGKRQQPSNICKTYHCEQKWMTDACLEKDKTHWLTADHRHHPANPWTKRLVQAQNCTSRSQARISPLPFLASPPQEPQRLQAALGDLSIWQNTYHPYPARLYFRNQIYHSRDLCLSFTPALTTHVCVTLIWRALKKTKANFLLMLNSCA